MLLDLARWFFINTMVAVGLAFLAAHPPLLPQLRNAPSYRWRDALFFTAMGVFCVLFPWKGESGVQLDLRVVVVVLAGWMEGLPVAIPVAAATLATRLLIGGGGINAPIVMAGFALLAVIAVRRLPRTMPWLITTAIASVAMLYLAITRLVPDPPAWTSSPAVWLQLAAMYVISFGLLNAAFNHIKETERLRVQLDSELKAKAAVLELLPYGVIFLDPESRVIGANEAARGLCAGPVADLLTQPALVEALRERRRLSGLRLTATAGGAATQLLVAAIPLEDGYVLGVENVTNVVAEERLEAQRDRLELLGQLSAMAAHEIKNPLTTIKGFLQLLERMPEFAGQRGALGLMLGEAEHINRVVGDFLVLAGRQANQFTSITLDSLLGEVLELAALQYPQGGIRVRLTGVNGLALQADVRALKQILRNLVANAYEAMPEGGELLIDRDARGDLVQVTVTDTGPGIPPEMLPLIFRPYVTTKTTGTGLGLAISHKLALEMGGQLALTSEVGKGSTFTLTLPRLPAAALVAASGQD